MNDRNAPERLIADWFAFEAPPRPPDQLRDEILTATARIRPRPGWLARLKGNHMNVIVGGRARRQPRLVPLLAVLGLLLLAVVATVVMVGTRPFEPRPAPLTITPIGLPGAVVQTFASEEGVWTSTASSPSGLATAIHRIDPSTNAVSTVVAELPFGHNTFVVVAGTIWASHDEGGRAVAWDATTGQERFSVDIGTRPIDPVAAFGSSWHPIFREGSIARIDPATGTATTIHVDDWTSGPLSLAQGGDRLWALSPDETTLVGIDPATNTIVERIPYAGQRCTVAYLAERLWLLPCGAGAVDVLDPATGETLASVEPGGQASTPFEHAGRVWMGLATEGRPATLVAVDPVAFTTVTTHDPGVDAPGFTVGPDALWFASEADVVRYPKDLLPAP